MRKLYYFGLLGLFVFSASSCEVVCAAIHLADMVCSKLAVAIPTVETGTAFKITTVIKNVAESSELCETETAGSSDTEYQVKYRPDENSPWDNTQFNTNGELVFEVFVPTQSLEPDADTGIEPGFKMETVGQYRFEGMADGRLNVEERNEANNSGDAEGELNGRPLSSTPNNVVIVTVVAKSGYHAPEGEPVVEYLGYTTKW